MTQVEASRKQVGPDGRWSGNLGPRAEGASAVELHLPQAILGSDEPLPEPGIGLARRFDMRHAPRVASHSDRPAGSRDHDRPVHLTGPSGGRRLVVAASAV